MISLEPRAALLAADGCGNYTIELSELPPQEYWQV